MRTKLFRPRLASELVGRPRLIERLEGVGDKPLALVSAPAGFGKSVLVSQWADACDKPVAWLSLDQDDSDLPVFLAYLLASLDEAFPIAGGRTSELLEAPFLPPISSICEHLVEDIVAVESDILLVLDDYHRIDPLSPVNELMDYLLANPPEGLRIILVTRRDPPFALTAMRSEDLVVEVRMGDLRFSDSETAQFMAEESKMTIGEEALRNLQDEVEGWAVGLRLVTLALRHSTDPDSFLRQMHGGLALTREYLMQEVLGTMPVGSRRYLLLSSILDRFNIDVLDALFVHEGKVQKSNDGAVEFLRELNEASLFLIDLDEQGNWYRYHHLFQELLLLELRKVEDEQRISELNVLASSWFEGAVLIDEALKYALRADDLDRAVQLVVRHRQAAVDQDHWYSLEKWLSLLPEMVIQGNPELLMARAWVLMHHVRFEALLPLADQIEGMLSDGPDQDHLRGEIAFFRGYVLYFIGDSSSCLEFMSIALAKIPEDFDEARAQTDIINALAKQMGGQKDQALVVLDAQLANYDSHNDFRKTRLVVTQVFIHFLAGDLDACGNANDRLLRIAEGGGYAYATIWSVYLRGLANLQRFEIQDAREQLERTVSQRHIHFKRAAVDSIVALMLTQQIMGDPEGAQATLQLLKDYVATLDDQVLWSLVGSGEARLAILAKESGKVDEWLDGADLPPEGALLWWFESPATTYCRALIAVGSDGQVREADARLGELLSVCESHHNIIHMIELLVLRASACEVMGRNDEAIDFCARALDLARPGGLFFPFVEAGKSIGPILGTLWEEAGEDDFISRILAARGRGAAAETSGQARSMHLDGDPELVEDLTERESEILGLLKNRLHDKEIADHLDISAHTVKHHLKQIYQKLDVHERGEAVRRASEFGLLGDEAAD